MAKSKKQEQREDTFTKITKKTEQFLRNNFKTILYTVLALVILAASYFTLDHLLNRKEVEAEGVFSKVYLAYSNALADSSLDDEQLKDTLIALNDDFAMVVEQYPNSSAASRSAYHMGNTLFRYGNYAEALEQYAKGAQIKPNGYSALLSIQGQASCYEQLGEYENAQERYNHIIEKYGDSFLVPMVKFSLGQIYEKQEMYDEAKDQYDGIVTDYSWSSWASIAEKKILLLKHKGSVDEA